MAHLEPVDAVVGGFPCQPTSVAGKRRGKADDRWLWPELAGLLGVVRPRWVLLENPTGLLAFPEFGEVLGDLARLGFDAEWDAVPAAAVGAPHERDRVFVVAYAARFQPRRPEQRPERERVGLGGESESMADTDRGGLGAALSDLHGRQPDIARGGQVVADAPQRGRSTQRRHADSNHGQTSEVGAGEPLGSGSASEALAHSDSLRRRPQRQGLNGGLGAQRRREGDRQGESSPRPLPDAYSGHSNGGSLNDEVGGLWLQETVTAARDAARTQWGTEPDVGRVAYGIPARVDRLTRLGNAVVPQVAEVWGRLIMEAEKNAG